MELTNNTTVKTAAAPTAPTPAAAAAEEIEVETPSTHQIQKPKPFSFGTNGVLKRNNKIQVVQHHGQYHPEAVVYRECLKNHAAHIGAHAVDGCGEFMPSSTVKPTDPTSLKCSACGCHRNFHRREPEETGPQQGSTAAIEYQPHHRHHPPPPPPPPQPPQLQLQLPYGDHSSPNSSPSPPPISSAYYPPSAPQMLLALSAGLSGEKDLNPASAGVGNKSNSRKRFRTKFTADQKGRMLEFAEKVGWKMQKRDEDLVRNFCNEIGVEKGVLKVWMHNNKNNFVGKKLGKHENHCEIFNNNNGTNSDDNNNNNGFCFVSRKKKEDDSHNQVVINHAFTTNGSSSS